MSSFDPPAPLVREAVALALAEDLGPLGDVTTALVADEAATAHIVVHRRGVLAGTACATETWAQLDDGVHVAWTHTDGDPLAAGDVVATVTGPLPPILTGERTALNFLGHLSGVATLTRQFVDAAGSCRVSDTRKTLPGLRVLEKAAVRAGGGVNHRRSLSDLVLVKDNHLRHLGITEAVRQARRSWPDLRVEVECDRSEQVHEAIEAGVDVVMLDNMTPEDAAKCATVVRESSRPDTVIEVSGGVTLDNVAAYAAAGADVCSTSAITQSAPALDLSLELGPNRGDA
jgi:nicotinate-nucleotide pyrophosphorylase (carboxylating)